ncbi:MAG: DJ-1/PfpI family protein [Bacteroidota bacterium]
MNNRINNLLQVLIIISILIFNGCQSIKTFTKKPEPFQGDNNFEQSTVTFDTTKKNIFIVANTKSTELFDMIAPFYLFNVTGKANVFIVAENKFPIQVKDKLYVLPQITFHEIDSLRLHADVIVIPFLGVIDTNQNPVIVSWIKNHYSTTTKILSVCDGAATAAATGIFDGKPMTCHASDYTLLTPNFHKPVWVQQVSVAHSGNLYSTAGVSNAVEGSLLVINDLFGRATMQQVMTDIHYKYPEIKLEHQSIAVHAKDKITIVEKILFRKNRYVGVLLQHNANEFELASIIDTYSRTFPADFKVLLLKGRTVKTKYGLTLISSQDNNPGHLSELHILKPQSLTEEESLILKNVKVVSYENSLNEYPIDVFIKRISIQYGSKFATTTKVMLDYN